MTERTLFLQARDIPDPADRAAFLDRACGPAADLRKRVDALLAAAAAGGGFLEAPADAPTGRYETTPDAPPAPGVGTVIAGRYKLLEAIGEGGMGTVFMAEQTTPVRRLVALKLIKAGMDSKAVLARFEAERQALALMDHPNIARVLDAGATADGRPFFVMELVKGTPVTKFCDERKLPPRQRLELFVPVCRAIQHAHQKGVIHRDIKPTNVLVALYDGHPVPKVIDFGVAKAAGQPLTERTLHTGFGAIVGTPEYMSPEQATFNQLDIDTRSDVYALGVLLYELLIGATPVDKTRLKEAAILEVLRMVREDEPPRPSVKLTTADTRAGIAATRGTEPDKLSKLLRGELDWIVMKALEKDRNRRYDTAAGLARDVQRYLADEMVEARPPSVRYRLRRYGRKNKARLLVGWLVFCMLVAWYSSLSHKSNELYAMFTREFAARLEADEQRNEAERQRAEAEHQRRMAERNLAEKEMARLAAEGQRLRADGERFRAERSEKEAKAAVEEARSALNFFQYSMLVANSKRGPATTLRQVVETAEPLVATTFKTQPRNEARVRLLYGQMYAHWDNPDEAIRQLDRAVSLLTSDDATTYLSIAITAFVRAGDPDRAISAAKAMVAGSKAHLEADHPSTLRALARLASLYDLTSRPAEAEPRWREAVTGWHRRGSKGDAAEYAVALQGFGKSLVTAGKPAEAEPVFREWLSVLGEKAYSSPAWMEATELLGASLLGQKKYAEAETVLLGFFVPYKPDEKFDATLQPFVTEVVNLLVKLYEETDQPAKAAEWRKRRPPEVAPTPRPAKP